MNNVVGLIVCLS